MPQLRRRAGATSTAARSSPATTAATARPFPSRCPACASVSVARHGAGTERIEHELRDALGGEGFPIFRLDADSVTLDQRAGILQRFEAADSAVLVGTQMVAKGHDFPDVSLGVVIDADQTLRFPDFRAEERTFALVTQLAGRTGRGAHGDRGRVLVQTLAPDARPIRYATEHDAEGFVADELERRRALSYPPFATLIRVVCSAVDETLPVSTAAAIARRPRADRRRGARAGAAVQAPGPRSCPGGHQGGRPRRRDRRGRGCRRPDRAAARPSGERASASTSIRSSSRHCRVRG